MTIPRFFLALALAGALGAQTFVHLTDPQFGMYASNAGFAQETANLQFAVAAVNRIKPAFVIVTGDLVNNPSDISQVAEYRRIMETVDARTKVYQMPGNHDTGNDTTAESLALYRQRFGADYYSFHSGDIAAIVLNSGLEKGADKVADEAAKMEKWFSAQLERFKLAGAKQIVVFQHVPFFIKDPAEADNYDNIPKPVRERYLHLLHEYGVEHVFCGHLHYNLTAHDGDLEMIASGPVGKPYSGGRSGITVVTVKDGALKHEFRDFGDLP
jgi:serine/threonine-protein phosphatase CPPED1